MTTKIIDDPSTARQDNDVPAYPLDGLRILARIIARSYLAEQSEGKKKNANSHNTASGERRIGKRMTRRSSSSSPKGEASGQ